jgi:hypothetical protein
LGSSRSVHLLSGLMVGLSGNGSFE